MKKISLLTVILFTIFNFVAINSSIVNAQVSQTWVCPAGFTCTPISAPSVPVVCPAGFTCVPTVVNNNSVVISPKAGEVYSVGSQILIKWNENYVRDVENYNLILKNSKTGIVKIIADSVRIRSSGIDGTSSYSWTIPQVDSGSNYQIEIYRPGGREATIWSGEFSIRSSYNPSPSPSPSTSPAVLSCSLITTNLKIGDISNDVSLLHDFLIAKGYSFPSINSGANPKNYFGTETLGAVMKYQKSIGVSDTGFVGPMTRAVINGSCNNNGSSVSNQSVIGSQIVSVELLNVFIDRAGTWKNFKPGSGNFNKNNGDWNWVLNLRLGSTKTISRITIKHNTYGEVWSTGYSRYLKDGTDLYGYQENPYPIVVSYNGNQINSDYDQVLGTYQPGDHKLILNGQPESERFTGAQIIIEFSDGTKTSGVIASPSFTQPKCPIGFKCSDSVTTSSSVNSSPSPTITPASLMVSINSPRQGDTWSIGETKTISWNYNNLDSTIYGNKYVDVLLVPSDGREPVKLGTNISAPSNSLPVKIYEKTSDGRSAWLSGNYKIRVVCQTTNAARFNSCYGESASFKVISPSPSPSPTVGATVR